MGTINWEEQRVSAERPRRRVWPWVLGAFACMTACALLSLAVAFGIMGGIIRLIDAPSRGGQTIIEYGEYGPGCEMRGMRGSERRGCCDCGGCPNAGEPGAERDYIEYYYEGDEGALPDERGGRITIELDEEGVHGQMREGEIRIAPEANPTPPTPVPSR